MSRVETAPRPSPIVPGRTPFVVLGDDWGRHVSTQQHLFRRIAPHYPLIWINSFGHRRPTWSWYDARRAVAKVRSMLFAPPPPLPDGAHELGRPKRVIHPKALPWHDLAWVRAFNARTITRDIRAALDAVAPGERPVLVSGTPAGCDIIGSLEELVAIYFCLDDYGELPGVEKDLLAPLEAGMLERVDAVVATAAVLTERKRPASGRTLHLPQGVNYEHFAEPRDEPADLRTLPRPRLGFAGGVGAAIDFAIIRALAAAFPEGSVVLVGPRQPELTREEWPPNVILVGARPYEQLPAYVQAFDVGLIPYGESDWTRAVDPLKLLEYLAAGIPVVSTAIPEVYKYRDVTEIAAGRDAFVQAVRRALEARSPVERARRQAMARANRWEVRAEQFLAFAGEVATARHPS